MGGKFRQYVLYLFTITFMIPIVMIAYMDLSCARVHESITSHAEFMSAGGLVSYNEMAPLSLPLSQMIKSTLLPEMGPGLAYTLPGNSSSMPLSLLPGIPGSINGIGCNGFPPMAPIALPIMEPAYFPAMGAEVILGMSGAIPLIHGGMPAAAPEGLNTMPINFHGYVPGNMYGLMPNGFYALKDNGSHAINLNNMQADLVERSTGTGLTSEPHIFATPSLHPDNNDLKEDIEAINSDIDETYERSKEYISLHEDEIVMIFYPNVPFEHIKALLARCALLGCMEKEKSRRYPSWSWKKHTATLKVGSLKNFLYESEIYRLKAHLSMRGRYEREYASEILRKGLVREYQRSISSGELDPFNIIQYIEPKLDIPKRKSYAFYPNDLHFQKVPSISNPLVLTRPQWYLDEEHLNLPLAWEDPVNNLIPPYLGTGIVIAVLDSGLSLAPGTRISGPTSLPTINPLLTDLAGVTISPYFWNFIDNNNNIDETPYYTAEGILTSTQHGTFMIGCIAQTINNIIGSAGIASDVTIMPIKVVGPTGADYTDLANGIYYAVDNGARVINLSLGGPVDSLVEQAAIDYAFDNNVAVICAAGNNGQTDLARDTPVYPAAYLTTIAVSATDYNNDLAFYSSIGNTATGSNYIPGTSAIAGTAPLDAAYTDDDYVSGSTFIIDVCAPGGDIIDGNQDGYTDGILAQHIDGTFYSVIIDDVGNEVRFVDIIGTSPACALVSGIVALMIQKAPLLTPNIIKQRLRDTANFATLPATITLDYPSTVIDPFTGAITIIITTTTYTTVAERELLFGQGLVDAAAAVHFAIIPPVPDPLTLLPVAPFPVSPPSSRIK
ncbi:MAG: S8 family peptidase [bacterium]